MAKLQEDVKLYSEKAQEALLKADQEAKKAAAVAKAEAMKDYESQLTALQKKLTDADASLKKAMAEAEIAQKTAQDETARQLANLKKEQAAELSKILAGHAREVAGLNGQIALLRSGAKVAITSQEVLQSDRAATAYSKGLLAYFDRNYSDAESRLLQATKDYPNDARYWYFLGLAQFELGKRSDAETAFQKGADLELQFQPSSREVATSLERVQGPARRLLNKYRP
jgi:TolA-binding protein